MSPGARAPQGSALAGVQPGRLFTASCISLISTAVVFSTITSMLGQIRDQFGLTNAQVGFWVGSMTIVGFPIAIVILGPLCDALGMRVLMRIAFLCHIVGVLLMVFATGLAMLAAGALLLALGNGTVEAACNPLTATLFPDRKTEKLNKFHMWWPGGLVLGGLAAYGIDKIDPSVWKGIGYAAWQIKVVLVLIPTIIYGILFTGQKFPSTERVQAGISFGGMVKATLLRPLFIILFFCMMITASIELGPNRWMGEAMKGALASFGENAGILALVYISALMAVLRYFAGPLVHSLSNAGVLLLSAALSGVGLLLLTYAGHSALMVFVTATIFGAGICYFWPTMLGTAAERIPKGGALALAMLGGVGNLAVGFIAVPLMGVITDSYGYDKLVDGKTMETKVVLTEVVAAYPAMKITTTDKEAAAAIQEAADMAATVLKESPEDHLSMNTPKALRLAESAAPNSEVGKKAHDLLAPADEYGTLMSFRWVSALSIILVLVFGGLYLRDRAKGGYKAEKIVKEGLAEGFGDGIPPNQL